jgi:hypothetical protein
MDFAGSRRALLGSLALTSTLVLVLSSTALATHARPGSASPDRVALVPAYTQCVSPNSSHDAGDSVGSCTPPVQESSVLTIQSNGAGGGFVRLDVFCTMGGLPPCLTPAGNRPDLNVVVLTTDVQCQGAFSFGGCSAAGDDYTGDVLLHMPFRYTDHANGSPPSSCANPGGTTPCETATVLDFPFDIPFSCAATSGSPNGSDCNLATTFNSFFPGFISGEQFQRAVFRLLEPLSIEDPGVDGTINSGAGSPVCAGFDCGTGDENVFEAMGWFVP